MASAGSGPGCPGQGNNDAVPHLSASSRPVVLVHGWDGNKGAMDAVKQHLNAPAGVGPLLAFDYGNNSQRWASVPAIASCLADYLNQVSGAYRSAGGDGRLLVVAHSMGGLATRFATDSRYAANPALAAVGGLITLDTPALGSPWGDQAVSRLAEVTIGKHPAALWPAPAGTDGSICLAPHDGNRRPPAGCAVAPYLPSDTSVGQVVGQITVRRTLFGLHLYDIDLGGDAIVPSDSSGGYPGSGPPDGSGNVPRAPKTTGGETVSAQTASCTTSSDAVTHVLETGAQAVGTQLTHPLDLLSGVWSFARSQDVFSLGDLADQRYGPSVMVLLLGAELSAPCSHSGILSFGPALSVVRGDLAAMNATLAGRHYCGRVRSAISFPLDVRVVTGDVSCPHALSVARGYFALPEGQLAGSGAFGMVGSYSCESTSGTEFQQTGHASDCTSGVNHISLDRPTATDCGGLNGLASDILATDVGCTLAKQIAGSVYAGDPPPAGYSCTDAGGTTFPGINGSTIHGTEHDCVPPSGNAVVRVLIAASDNIGVHGLPGASLCTSPVNCYPVHSAGGGPVNVRNDTNTSAAILATLADGEKINVVCRGLGQQVTGPAGTTSYWDQIQPSGTVSDAFIGAADALPDC